MGDPQEAEDLITVFSDACCSIAQGFSKIGMKENYQFNSDSKTWQAFKLGSENAFALIYQKHSPLLFSYGMHIVKDPDLVKDCLQNMFVDLWDNRARLGDTDSIKYYLFTCLKRRIVAELLANKKYRCIEEIAADYNFEIVFSHESSLVADQMHQEENANLSIAINKLTKRQKEAIYLLYYSKLSHQEAASLMSIKVTAVYNLVYNALISLKKNMVLVDKDY